MSNKLLAFLALFTSTGTLICCALPALFVSLGFGAAFVSLLGAISQLIWFSEHKTAVFITAGLFIVGAAAARVGGARLECPVEAGAGQACREARGWGRPVLYLAVTLYLIGGFFSFVAPIVF